MGVEVSAGKVLKAGREQAPHRPEVALALVDLQVRREKLFPAAAAGVPARPRAHGNENGKGKGLEKIEASPSIQGPLFIHFSHDVVHDCWRGAVAAGRSGTWDPSSSPSSP